MIKWPPGRELSVCCIDLSVNKGLAAFSERYTHLGAVGDSAEAFDADGVRTHLARRLAETLRSVPVALGLEGPMWGTGSGPLGPYTPRPFEDGTYSWCGQTGAPAALKAYVILKGVLSGITAELRGTPDLEVLYAGTEREFTWGPGRILLWEAFVAGRYKEVDVEVPADRRFFTRAARPAIGGRVSHDLLDAARAVRAGFANRPVSKHGAPSGPLGMVVPIAGAALRAAGVPSPEPWWDGPCAVVAPGRPDGELLWP